MGRLKSAETSSSSSAHIPRPLSVLPEEEDWLGYLQREGARVGVFSK